MNRVVETVGSTGPVITGWSAVSAFGHDAGAFRAGLRAGRPAPDTAAAAAGQSARLVPGFEPREVLGRKGTRSMDRVTALAVATVGHLVDRDADAESGDPDAALVLGTTTGSAQSMMDFTRSSLTERQPYFVDPARFPNTVMNCAAGQCAIWYRLEGPNATIAGGRTAGLLAMNYARRLHRGGRARTVLCGAVEEYSPARSWLHHHARGHGAVLGEGCAVLRLEPAGSTGLAEVIAQEFGVFGAAEEIGPVLAASLRRAFKHAGVDPADTWAVAVSTADDGELAGVRDVLGEITPRSIPCAELIGDTSAASAAFQISAVLATAADDPDSAGRIAVVTAVDSDYTLGAALLRLPPAENGPGAV